ncbi:hypothetical protein FKP32DRAFT_1758393 [Trametes sanguinea]|nr:hypothetical protein FKP32DRAFT_1758393 [Trametes sanguinea]
MPSVRVKKSKGYLSIDDAPQGRPRSQSLVSLFRPAPPQVDQGTELQRTCTRASDGAIIAGGRPPVRRARASSRVSDHILSTSRQSPQLPPARSPQIPPQRPPQTPLPGPSQLSDIQESQPHSFSRRRADSYTIEGEQASLRVPIEGDRRRASSSRLSLALEQLDHDQERHDSLEEHHPDDIVEHLDVIDPQISTVSTLTNAANAIVVPPLSFYSRKPVVVLPRLRKKKRRKQHDPEKGTDQDQESEGESEYEDALDQHVEDVLTKRDQFRRVMQGVWSFVKTPLGIVTAIYGFLVVFWGTGIVFFLAKFINLHNDITQGFWVELCQQVETGKMHCLRPRIHSWHGVDADACAGLFTATSIGFIPFRIMDTYRICKIWHYKRKIGRLRRKAGLPELYDPDDLPDPVYDPNYIHVLTEEEQIDLHYQQHKFMQSQTWYRPHGTPTHRAFPIDLALWICVCNDLNSFFQCLLSGTMWGLDRFARPAWTTGTTLPAAFVAGIVAGVLIYWGGRKTRRTKEVTERLRIALQMEREHQNGHADTASTASASSARQEGSPMLPKINVQSADDSPQLTADDKDAGEGGDERGVHPAVAAPSPSTDSATTETATEHGAGAGIEKDEVPVDSLETVGKTQPHTGGGIEQQKAAHEDAEGEVGLQPSIRPANERRASGRSLRFADEMVVPPAEDLSPSSR